MPSGWALPGSGSHCVEHQGIVHYGTADGLSDNMITALAMDTNQVLWIGRFPGALNRISAGSLTNFGLVADLTHQPVTAILPLKRGKLWIGYGDGGVVSGVAGVFKQVIDPAALGGRAVRALYEDSAGRIWLGTAGGQLACIMSGRYLNWDLNLQPSDNAIHGILTDDDGDLWLATDRAIYHVVQVDKNAALAGQMPMNCQPVYEASSVSSSASTLSWPQAAKSLDGKLWFGMGGGASRWLIRDGWWWI